MVKKFRPLLGIAVLSVGALLLTGCSAASDVSTQPEESASPSKVEGMLVKDGVLTVALSQSPPYAQKEDSGSWTGTDVDIVDEIASRLGVKVDYIDTKFDALIPGLQAERFDLATNIGDFVERQEAVTFVDYAQSQLTIEVTADGKFQPKKMQDLCGAVVGFETGTAGGTTASEYLPGFCKDNGLEYAGWVGYPDRTQLELALRSERIEGLAAPVASNDLSAAESDGFFVNLKVDGLADLPGVRAIYGLVTPKDSPLAELIQETLLEMAAEGLYSEIFETWGIPNSQLPEDEILVNGSTLTRE